MKPALRLVTITTVLFVALFALSGFSSHSATKVWSEQYEAESGALHNLSTESIHAGFSGEGYVAGWNRDGQYVDIEVIAPAAGAYTLTFRYSAAAGDASRYLYANGNGIVDNFVFSGTGSSWSNWSSVSVHNVMLNEGSNVVSLIFNSSKGSKNWLNYDYLAVETETSYEWGLKAGQAEQAQSSLNELFWNEETNLFRNKYQCSNCNGQFHYWWQAHAIDTLIDGYERTGDHAYIDRAAALFDGVTSRNSGITNHFYDDMLWMGLALLRLSEITQDERHEHAVFELWEDVKTGWNDRQGGGIAWNKSQLGYKNTPSNAPAVILAARLYQKYGNEEDMEWAKKIYAWEKSTLVDPASGLVWDGINRTGDGSIDKNWRFTYNQGTFIGASVELYRATGDPAYLTAAARTAETTRNLFANRDGVIQENGAGDAGLFKGILVRYLKELFMADASRVHAAFMILKSAESAWNEAGTGGGVLFGSSWSNAPSVPVDLSQQLSGVMLMEQAAAVELPFAKAAYSLLRERFDESVAQGEVTGPLVPMLSNMLDQAGNHLGRGDANKAVVHLLSFRDQLNNPALKKHIDNEVKVRLTETVDFLLLK
ncbi:glycoside hydrolase family 76 protein [Paenibacillus thermotolerans]|uniref:glycoside hydrolase family 76 protein n=1 Tax=Paenibacillus thermotolerans TaxID=3027807 RepID=UPI002367FF5E|nr:MULTISPECIES: glycoside hydrolase family 76 protein [unclassified Paenibacillus]